MKITKHRSDRETRSKQPVFARRVAACEWPDMRIIYVHENGAVVLVRAADVTWLDERPLGLLIPAGTTIYTLTTAEYRDAGFYTVE
jgi:hypothetical protein